MKLNLIEPATLRRAAVTSVNRSSFVAVRANIVETTAEGQIVVTTGDGKLVRCDWLESGASGLPELKRDDLVLVMLDEASNTGVVVGVIAPYRVPTPTKAVSLEATDTLSLSCGASSIELRADGKVLIRGEDVLVRAKGTKRIRAGTVSIN